MPAPRSNPKLGPKLGPNLGPNLGPDWTRMAAPVWRRRGRTTVVADTAG